MAHSSVLIISQHPLLVAAIRYAVEHSGIESIFHVEDLAAGMTIVREEVPGTIIVEVRADTSCEELAARLLLEHSADCQVVCISLDSSDMTVFTRRYIPRAAQSDLITLLRQSLVPVIEERV